MTARHLPAVFDLLRASKLNEKVTIDVCQTAVPQLL